MVLEVDGGGGRQHHDEAQHQQQQLERDVAAGRRVVLPRGLAMVDQQRAATHVQLRRRRAMRHRLGPCRRRWWCAVEVLGVGRVMWPKAGVLGLWCRCCCRGGEVVAVVGGVPGVRVAVVEVGAPFDHVGTAVIGVPGLCQAREKRERARGEAGRSSVRVSLS